MKDIRRLIRKNIKELMPYSSARSEFMGSASVFLDANENPFDEVLKYNRYPDPLQFRLKTEISKRKKIPIENIFLSNGSDEAIDIIIRIFCEPGSDTVLTFSPGFGMFKVAAAINNVNFDTVSLDKDYRLNIDALQEKITQDVKVIFLCTPNNPTGSSIPNEAIIKLCRESEAIIVVDEAYIDFSSHASMIIEVLAYSNLIVLQTLSKAYGGAGLRLGMAFANQEIIHFMNNIKMPYNISAINQSEALKLIRNVDSYEAMLDHVLEEKKRMWEYLNRHPIIQKVYPSDANFFLVKIPDASNVYSALVSKGVIVRNLSKKPGCEDCLRITVGTKEQNNILYSCLDELMN